MSDTNEQLVLNSEQYELFQSISSFLTAVILDSDIHNIISTEFSSKLNCEDELLITPIDTITKYFSDIQVDGSNIGLTTINKPYLQFNFEPSTTVLTTDNLSTYLNELNSVFSNASDYAAHYPCGVLNQLSIGLSDELITPAILSTAIAKHTDNPNAHQNISTLKNYYLKYEIEDKHTDINNTITYTSSVLNNDLQQSKKNLNDLITQHKNNIYAHQDITGLNNYYERPIIDSKLTNVATSFAQNLNNHAASANIRFINNEDKINKNILDIKTQTEIYNKAHSDNEPNQIISHTFLAAKNNTQLFGNNFKINDDRFNSVNPVQISIYGSNKIESQFTVAASAISLDIKNNNLFSVKFNNNSVIDITPEKITTKKDITTTNNTNFYINHNISLNNISDIVPNTRWVEQYINNIKNDLFDEWCKKYHNDHFGSMPDWARPYIIETQQRNITGSKSGVSQAYKVNVPGYLTIHAGHCSDADIIVLASYDPQNLNDYLGQNGTGKRKAALSRCIKITEAFGHGDAEQSSFMVPIYPGTSTYILPVTDNFGRNWSQLKWVFLPCLSVSQYTTNKNKYLTKQPYYRLGNYHPGLNITPDDDVWKLTFNYVTNGINCWLENI